FLVSQGTILRRWKKNWFDLWSDGRLIFYDDQHRRDMEDKIHMRVDCINIRTGGQCRDYTPPEGRSRDSLLQLVCREGRTINLCAESADDALAWSMALQDARVNTVTNPPQVGLSEAAMATAPPPYAEYAPSPQVFNYDHHGNYGQPPPLESQIVYASNGQPYAVAYPYQYPGPYPAPGVNQVVVRERYRDDNGDVALGMLAGAATGMALGSLFWVF
ncbi:PKHB2 protein, partial [Amia calva]|nr:PKHB2 protein [Amia calva]